MYVLPAAAAVIPLAVTAARLIGSLDGRTSDYDLAMRGVGCALIACVVRVLPARDYLSLLSNQNLGDGFMREVSQFMDSLTYVLQCLFWSAVFTAAAVFCEGRWRLGFELAGLLLYWHAVFACLMIELIRYRLHGMYMDTLNNKAQEE